MHRQFCARNSSDILLKYPWSQTYSGCYMRRVFASQILITSHHAKPIRPGPILLRANRFRFPSGELWAAKTSPSWIHGLHCINMGSTGQKVFSQSHSFAELWFKDREVFCLRVKIYDLRPPGYWEKSPSVLNWACWERMWGRHQNGCDLI